MVSALEGEHIRGYMELCYTVHCCVFINPHIYTRAVYVEVDCPTSATGINLQPQGYEHYHIRGCTQGEYSDPSRVIQDQHEYISVDAIQVYKLAEPLAIGKYVIPFQYTLPQGLPASFSRRSEDGPEWKVTVYYGLKAEFIDTCTTHTPCLHELIVYESVSYEEGHTTQTATCDLGGLFKSEFKVTAYIDSPMYTVGDNVKVTVEFKPPKSHKSTVKVISVQLLRELRVEFGKERFLEADPSSPLQELRRVFRFTGPAAMYSLGAEVTESASPPGSPLPNRVCTERVIVHQVTLRKNDTTNLLKGVEKLLVPIKTKLGSTNARFIKSELYVTVEVTVNDSHLTLQIRVPHVRCKHTQPCVEPVWVSDEATQIILSQHEAQISADNTPDREFSSMPRTWDKINSTCVRLSGSIRGSGSQRGSDQRGSGSQRGSDPAQRGAGLWSSGSGHEANAGDAGNLAAEKLRARESDKSTGLGMDML